MEISTSEKKIDRRIAQLVFENKELTRTKFSFLRKINMIEHKLKENERFLRENCNHEWRCLDDGCMYERPTKICNKCNIYK